MATDTLKISRTDAIHVDMLDFASGPALGMMPAPGRTPSASGSGKWRRSLDADLEHLVQHHEADDLVSLIEDQELASLQIEDLAERCEFHGLALHRSPIRDMGIPTVENMRALAEHISALRDEGRQVVVHCMGGYGRTGTVAACCLVHTGVPADQAITRVRSARPGTIETSEQFNFIHAFAAAQSN